VRRYEPESDGSFYVIRDHVTGELVQHQTLAVAERYRSERRLMRRIAELEAGPLFGDPGSTREAPLREGGERDR
jgi:hypothetical protein